MFYGCLDTSYRRSHLESMKCHDKSQRDIFLAQTIHNFCPNLTKFRLIWKKEEVKSTLTQKIHNQVMNGNNNTNCGSPPN